MQRDEYGDIPGQAVGSQYGTVDSILPDANLHVRGTIPRFRNGHAVTEFWMTAPRPRGVKQVEWDEITQARWDQAFS